MKKLIFSMAALATMLFASCQQELVEPMPQESTVTYTVELPGVQTKAIGDGFNVDQLVYEVWKTDAPEVRNLWNPETATRLYQKTVPMATIGGEQKTTITLNLVHDQNYTVLFWAQNSKAVKDAAGNDVPAYVTKDLRAVTYAKEVTDGSYLSNNENMAAFYNVAFLLADDVEKSGSRRVELKRPFAQLNIATKNTPDEYTVTVNKSKVQISNVPTVFDVAQNIAAKPADGIEASPAVTVEKSFLYGSDYVPGCSATDKEPLTLTVNSQDYEYVAMNYIFASGNVTVKYWIDVTLTATDPLTGQNNSTAATDDVVIENEVPEVPLKENYRTNIIGNLLSSNTTYEVVVDASWDDVNDPELNGDGIVVEVWDQKYIQEPPKNANGEYEISLASELAWLSAAVNGKLPATKADTQDPRTFKDETFVLKENVDLTGALWNPIGATGTFKGTFDGNGKTIKGLKVATEGAVPAGLFGNVQTATIKNVTVDGAEVSGHYSAAVIVAHGVCAKIENCHVKGNSNTVTSTVINNDDGNNVGGIVGYLAADEGSVNAWVKNSSVENTTITAFRKVGGIAGYANGSALVTENSVTGTTVITADQTVSYKTEEDGNAGSVVGGAHAKASITANTVGEDVTVVRKVDSTKELEYAAADAQDGDTIYIGAGEVELPHFENKALNFVGINDGATVIEPVSVHNEEFWKGAELNFTGLTIKGNAYGDGKHNGYVQSVKETYTDCDFVNYYMFAGDVTIVTECTFTNQGHYFWTGSAEDITFEKCAFHGTERAVKVACVGNTKEEPREVTFNDCTFEATAGKKSAIEIDNISNPYLININGCTFSGFAAGEVSGDAMVNIKYTNQNAVEIFIDGNKWVSGGVLEEEDGTKVYTSTTALQAAIKEANDGDVLILGNAKFDGLFQIGGKSITLKALNPGKAELAGRISVAGGVESTFTCEDLTLSVSDNTGAEFGNKYYDKGKDYIIGIYCGNVVVKNCTFTGMTDAQGAITYHSYSSGATTETLEKLVVENCTFEGGRAIRARSNVSVTGSTFKGLVNPCLQIMGLGDNDIKNDVVFTGNTSDVAISGVCIKTSNYITKNITFNVGNNTNCDYITFDDKNVNNLYPDTYTYTGTVNDLIPEGTNGLNYLMGKGVNVIRLLPGEYSLSTYKAGVKVEGTDPKEVIVDVAGKKFGVHGNVDIKNVTLKFANENYTGFQHTAAEKFTNCTIEGQPFLYGTESTVFDHCTFVQTLSDKYNVWTYGATNVEFKECTFNSAGKSVLIYHDGKNLRSNVTFNTCKFNASVPVEGKAAVEIDATLALKYVVNINNSNAYGFAEGSVSKNTLWNIKNEKDVNAEVYVNGNFVGGYRVDGSTTYVSTPYGLTTALASEATKNIVLMPGTYKGIFAIGNAGTTIDGSNNAAVVDCINLNGKDNVTLKNIKFDAAGAQVAYNGKGGKRFMSNIMSGGASKNAKGTRGLVVDGCIFEGEFAESGTVIAFNDQGRGSGQSGNITVTGCTFDTKNTNADIYTYYSGYGYLNIENNTFKNGATGKNIYLGQYQSSTPVVVKGNTFENCADFAAAASIQPHSSGHYTVSFDASDNTFAE